MLLSIVIPTYNEEKTILTILEIIEKINVGDIKKEIIVVDDGSTDQTRDILDQLKDKYKIILKEKNEGKGSAIQKGFLASTGDITIIQDADLEYDPNEYSKLIKPIVENHADVVYGSRFIGSDPHRVLYFWHYQANKFLTFMANMFGGFTLTDMECCYKVFNRKALDLIKDKITAKRFGIEPELTALISKHKNKLRIYEVGISYYGRTYQEGKKLTRKDGLAAIWHIIKYNLFR